MYAIRSYYEAERVEARAEVEVRLWGRRVGALVELESGVALSYNFV